jgi:hypothetical protein
MSEHDQVNVVMREHLAVSSPSTKRGSVYDEATGASYSQRLLDDQWARQQQKVRLKSRSRLHIKFA